MTSYATILAWFQDLLERERLFKLIMHSSLIGAFISGLFFAYFQIDNKQQFFDIIASEEGLPIVAYAAAIIYFSVMEDGVQERQLSFVELLIGKHMNKQKFKVHEIEPTEPMLPGVPDRNEDLVYELIRNKLNEEIKYPEFKEKR